MTDQELIEWVYRRLASDWSKSQLRRLGRHVRQSFAVRAAVRDRIMMDQLLFQTLAVPSFSPMQLLQACQAPPSAASPSAAPPIRGWKAIFSKSTLTWGMGIVIAAAAMTYFAFGPRNSPMTTGGDVQRAAPSAPPATSPPRESTNGHALPNAPLEAPVVPTHEPAPPLSAPAPSRPVVQPDEDDSPSDHLPPGYAPRPPLPPANSHGRTPLLPPAPQP